MSQNLKVSQSDFEPDGRIVWSLVLDQTDLQVLAEALDFYLEGLDPGDQLVIPTVTLIRHLRVSWPFAARMSVLFEKRMARERKNAV